MIGNVVRSDWTESVLGNVVSFRKGHGLPKSDLLEDGSEPCVHYGDLFVNYPALIRTTRTRCAPFPGAVRSEVGDVLMPTSDVTPSGLATASCIQESGIVIGGDVLILRPDADEVDGLFLAWKLKHMRSEILQLTKGSTVYHLYGSDLVKLSLYLPPLEEQRAIASVLNDVDELVESLVRLINKKRDVREGVLASLLSGRTRLRPFDKPWSDRTLGTLAHLKSGGTPPTSDSSFYSGPHPWVSISDMTTSGRFICETERTLTDHGLARINGTLFPAGTVLYAMYASVGECSIASVPVTTSQAILGITPGSELDSLFLYYVLVNKKAEAQRSGQQGTQSNLNKGMVQNFLIAMPPLDEQRAIADVLTDMDAEIEALEARLAKTRDLKTGMAQELLSGRTRLV